MALTALLVGFFAFAFAALLVIILLRGARSLGLLDVPNERSAHQHVMPRGGGAGIWVPFWIVLSFLWAAGHLPTSPTMALIGAVPLAIAGVLDDRAGLPIGLRLAIQAGCAVWSIAWLVPLPAVCVFGMTVPLTGPGVWLPFVLLVGAANGYNFMDGIDGLAGSETVFVCFSSALLVSFGGNEPWAVLCLALGCATMGFLVFNWPPARIFMGDTGSVFLGFTLAVVALATHAAEVLSLWIWGILLACFLTDVSWTLLRRLLSGKAPTQAHSNHAYQRAAQHHGHLSVAIGFASINLFWLFPLAVLALFEPTWAPLFFLVSLLVPAAFCFCYDAGGTGRTKS